MRVERTGFGKRILNSFVGLLLGIVLFFGSFVVIFLNEGRENLAKYAKLAQAYEEGTTYTEDDLVYLVGKVNATEYAKDNFLKDSSYLYIKRNVEIYAYVENEISETKENIGGSTTTVYTYSYKLEWTKTPTLKANFKGDQNEIPANIPNDYDTWIQGMPQQHQDKGTGFSINGISISSDLELSGAKDFDVTTDKVNASALSANEEVVQGFIYRKNSISGSINSPGVGDVRISYQVITNADEGVLLGGKNGSFVPFTTKKDNQILRFFAGLESQNEVVNLLQSEYKTSLWLFRLLGFLMMFIGLLLVANPLMTLLSVIPIFAKIGRFAFGILAFISSLILTSLTILLGMIFNNIYLAIGVILVLIFGIILILRRRSKNPKKRKK